MEAGRSPSRLPTRVTPTNKERVFRWNDPSTCVDLGQRLIEDPSTFFNVEFSITDRTYGTFVSQTDKASSSEREFQIYSFSESNFTVIISGNSVHTSVAAREGTWRFHYESNRLSIHFNGELVYYGSIPSTYSARETANTYIGCRMVDSTPSFPLYGCIYDVKIYDKGPDILVYGASIMYKCFSDISNALWNMADKNSYSRSIRSYAVSGDHIADTVTAATASVAVEAGYTAPKICVVHTGGNDVSSTRPYSSADKGALKERWESYRELIEGMEAAGATVVPCSVTYRNYSSVAAGNEYSGSRPYNEELVLPIIGDRRYLDLYNEVKVNKDWLSSDGIHMTGAGSRKLRDYILDSLLTSLVPKYYHIPLESDCNIYRDGTVQQVPATGTPVLCELYSPGWRGGAPEILDFTNGDVSRVTCTRISGGGVYDADGNYQWLPSGVPRIDHDPATGECLGLLMEIAATNLVPNTDLTAWTANSTAEVTEDDGWYRLDRISFSTASTIVSSMTSTAGTTYVASVEIRDDSPYPLGITFRGFHSEGWQIVKVDSDGDVVGAVSPYVEYIGKQRTRNGWRVSVKCTADQSNSVQLELRIHLATSTDETRASLHIRYPQLEVGDMATSFIPTSGSQVTRTGDIVKYNDLLPKDFALYAEYVRFMDDSRFLLCAHVDHRYRFDVMASSNTYTRIISDGSSLKSFGSVPLGNRAVYKLQVGPGDVCTSNTSLPNVPSPFVSRAIDIENMSLAIGCSGYASTGQLCGYVRKVGIYLSDISPFDINRIP